MLVLISAPFITNLRGDLLEPKRHAVFTTMGASNYRTYDRPTDDFYATDPIAVKKLLEVEKFHYQVYEPACGEKHSFGIQGAMVNLSRWTS